MIFPSFMYKNKDKLHGCSAERDISHILSDILSSRPMGWETFFEIFLKKVDTISASCSKLTYLAKYDII